MDSAPDGSTTVNFDKHFVLYKKSKHGQHYFLC